MSLRRHLLTVTFAASTLACWSLPAAGQPADQATAQALEGYFDFVDANAGTLLAEQIPAADYPKLHIVDVRDAAQFAKAHVPGAVNLEWRQVFAMRASLPRDKTILLYCNTSSLAAQVAMALRLDGFENVRLLYGGFHGWQAAGGLEANARAIRARSGG
jgi:rhodanese-related sulfurtransferase